MKILIVTPSYKPAFVYGGPTFSVSYLAQEISKAVDELLVLTTTANGKEELVVEKNTKQIVDGVNVIYFERQTKDHTHFSMGLLNYLWKNCSNYNCVHIQSWWNLVAIFSALICVLRGVKFVVSPRGMLSPYTMSSSLFKRLMHKLGTNFLLKKAIVHATSNKEIQQILSLNSSYKVLYAPNFVDLIDYKIERTANTEAFNILFLSRIHDKKGLELLFKSLSKVQDSFILNIVGDGESNYINRLKELSSNLKIKNSIIWHGSKYGAEKYNFYINADVMVLPSKDENFANNVLESLSLGTAVILSDKVGLADFVYDHNLGWVFDSTDFGLYVAIEEAIHNRDKLSKIREDARGIVESTFSPDVIVKQYLKIYNSEA